MTPSSNGDDTARHEGEDDDQNVCRVDLHVHSTASAEAKLAVSRGIGLPECATPPELVYETAKARGMDLVTITDHDTIAGGLELAGNPDFPGFFISEELTAWFHNEPQAVHVLCYGINPDDHEALQERAHDLEACAEYLHANEITCALAHPFFYVATPLESRHRRRLAEMFEIWETRNGSRATQLNAPALTYIDSHGGIGIGGSDDHGGLDIGRTFTETPAASDPEAFLAHLRAGRARARGDQGSAAKWAHSALALAARTLPETAASRDPGLPGRAAAPVDAAALLAIAEGVVSDGAARGGDTNAGVAPDEAATLLDAWAASLGLPIQRPQLLEALAADDAHATLERRARRAHERRLSEAAALIGGVLDSREDWPTAIQALIEACLPVIPHIPAKAILAREKSRLGRFGAGDNDPHRIALVVDGIDEVHGLSHVIQRIRELGVPGCEVEVVGTDPCVDRRLPAVDSIATQLYPGTEIGVPSLPELVDVLCDGDYDTIHVATPGPAGIFATLVARIAGMPLVCSHHTEFVSYAAARSSDPAIEGAARMLLGAFYRQARAVLSPSTSADRSLVSLGVEPERIWRWARGVDHDLYESATRVPREPRVGTERDDQVNVMYAGRLTREKGVDLLVDSFLEARRRDSRLHLIVAGGGPEEDWMRERLGDAASFKGWLDRGQLAAAYAEADIFLFCSQTDTYGQVIAEAQASSLAVVAVEAGGPASLIRDRQTGWLCPPESPAIASAVAQLAASPFLRERLGRRAATAVAGRTWEASLAELSGAYERVLVSAAITGTNPIVGTQIAA